MIFQCVSNFSVVLHELPTYAHWALTHSTKNYIEGSPGPKLRMSGGVQIRHGHAILDGLTGYLDSGDYQGECMSGKYFNPFIPKCTFSPLPEDKGKPYGFLMFSRGRERVL